MPIKEIFIDYESKDNSSYVTYCWNDGIDFKAFIDKLLFIKNKPYFRKFLSVKIKTNDAHFYGINKYSIDFLNQTFDGCDNCAKKLNNLELTEI